MATHSENIECPNCKSSLCESIIETGSNPYHDVYCPDCGFISRDGVVSYMDLDTLNDWRNDYEFFNDDTDEYEQLKPLTELPPQLIY